VPPFVGTAVKVVDCPWHVGLVPDVMEIPTAGVTVTELTVIVMVFEVALIGLEHGRFEVITQLTTWPFARADVLKVDPVPELLFPTFHWYVGFAPPFIGVAVNVTDWAEQIVVAEAEMLTEGTTVGFTKTEVCVDVADGLQLFETVTL